MTNDRDTFDGAEQPAPWDAAGPTPLPGQREFGAPPVRVEPVPWGDSPELADLPDPGRASRRRAAAVIALVAVAVAGTGVAIVKAAAPRDGGPMATATVTATSTEGPYTVAVTRTVTFTATTTPPTSTRAATSKPATKVTTKAAPVVTQRPAVTVTYTPRPTAPRVTATQAPVYTAPVSGSKPVITSFTCTRNGNTLSAKGSVSTGGVSTNAVLTLGDQRMPQTLTSRSSWITGSATFSSGAAGKTCALTVSNKYGSASRSG